ncbi:unnamed protein product [Clavelina lepadiformis]|uniref:dCMP deaminase n=1 Tax=Clavelina lepadiformis TaxID=159417 RepID=A0ABP0FXB4_CLALP
MADNNPINPVDEELPTSSLKRREDVLSWDDYFMGLAFLSGKRSKDPKTQVGACIVNKKKRIVGMGYNGMPDGKQQLLSAGNSETKSNNDETFSWNKVPYEHREKKEALDKEKKFYVCHAEMNAVVNSYGKSLEGCIIYVSLFPCNECAKLLIQSGIKKVVYYSDKKSEKNAYLASRKMLKEFRVEVVKHETNPKITIDFEDINEE